MTRLVLALAVLLAAPATAVAAGGPVPPVQGGAGVASLRAPERYVTIGVRGGTLVERISTRNGVVLRSRFLARRLGVPGVAYDGSTTGVSGDGGTLLLTNIIRSYPPKRTMLVALDPQRLRELWARTLRGYYAVDAISPDGQWVYLLRYPSANDPFRYQLLAFDVHRGRVVSEPIVDPREPDEKMAGIPLARTVTRDGRWAYTLYQTNHGEAFVHALDTVGRTAACIDLPSIGGGDVSTERLVLSRAERSLVVQSPAGPQAVIDTRTFAVREPAVPEAPERRSEGAAGGDLPWEVALLAVAALAAVPVLRWRRRRSGS